MQTEEPVRTTLAVLNSVAAPGLLVLGLIGAIGILLVGPSVWPFVLLPVVLFIGAAASTANGVILVCINQLDARTRLLFMLLSGTSALLHLALLGVAASQTAGQSMELAAVLLAALLHATTAIYIWARPVSSVPSRCERCGYDTSGLSRCPECGTDRAHP
ncbi:MAG: hypothetical protein AAFO89_02660 [Planctomycetota bacterium]